jgi:hypothetical protein
MEEGKARRLTYDRERNRVVDYPFYPRMSPLSAVSKAFRLTWKRTNEETSGGVLPTKSNKPAEDEGRRRERGGLRKASAYEGLALRWLLSRILYCGAEVSESTHRNLNFLQIVFIGGAKRRALFQFK